MYPRQALRLAAELAWSVGLGGVFSCYNGAVHATIFHRQALELYGQIFLSMKNFVLQGAYFSPCKAKSNNGQFLDCKESAFVGDLIEQPLSPRPTPLTPKDKMLFFI